MDNSRLIYIKAQERKAGKPCNIPFHVCSPSSERYWVAEFKSLNRALTGSLSDWLGRVCTSVQNVQVGAMDTKPDTGSWILALVDNVRCNLGTYFRNAWRHRLTFNACILLSRSLYSGWANHNLNITQMLWMGTSE